MSVLRQLAILLLPDWAGRSGRRVWAIVAAVLFGPIALLAVAQEPARRIDSLAELKQVSAEGRTGFDIHLTATVWYSDPANGHLILHDASGTAEVQMDLHEQSLQPGDRVAVAGTGTILDRGCTYELTRLAVVDNDGLHFEKEKAGTVRLEAGRHPIRVDWFNAGLEARLSIEYEGPGLSRRRIPDSVLWRRVEPGAGAAPEWRPGLEFRTYQDRQWKLPPNRNAGALLLKGVSGNFDCTVAGRREYAGADFTGYLEVPETGGYTFFLRSDDGSRLFVGPPSLRLKRLEPATLPAPLRLSPGQALQEDQDYLWAALEGRVSRASQLGRVSYLSLDSGAGHVRVEVSDTATLPWAAIVNRPVRMTGVVRRNRSADGIPLAATLFVQDGGRVELLEPPAGSADPGARPTLTPVERIERFDRSLLEGHPIARIRGVVTRVVSGVQGVVIQDETRGIYVDFNDLAPGPIQIGELLEVSGNVEAGEFSPFLIARELTRLGAGVMPVPVAATREEVANGSLHTQYVEIEGYVLAVDAKTVTLRTRAGVLRIDIETETSADWLNTVLRMRGCLRVFWDAQSRQITVGKVGLDYAEISIERPAPGDLFAVASKRASELLRFDPYAGIFQRTRLGGQVLHSNGTELCLMDEATGVRVSLAAAGSFASGDLVEVAGFPEFDGPSPHFAHAVARRVGHQPLPAARPLPADDLLRDEFDSTLVTVDAELIGLGFQDGRRTLQLRAGPNTFLARCDDPLARLPDYESGSRLRLTGVYGGMGGNRALGRPVEAFELVLAPVGAVQVLATPPWWTLPRLLTLVGILCFVLLAAFLWITILRRQVAVQTEQLRIVLQERHRVQQEEALARERSRLAYDLHDELGAGLSEIGMLGTLASAPLPEDKRDGYLARLTETVRRLIVSLDEIVWAVNPRYDAVSSFVGYYTAYAQQYLELASLRCRLDVADDLPHQPLTSRMRHTLFLAFKEALTNVVKHAQASEVVIRIFIEGRRLVVSVADNGRGLKTGETDPGMDGLASIRERLRQLEGECVVENGEPTGTRVSLRLPLP